MASFKVLRGLKENIPTDKVDGRMYFCTDTGDFYLDYKDESGALQRRTVNETELNNKANAEHLHMKNSIVDFPTSMPASDVSDWAKAPMKPTYTSEETGSDPAGTALAAIAEHNESLDVHSNLQYQINETKTLVQNTDIVVKNALSAYGITSGTGTEYILDFENYQLADGNVVKFQIHMDSGENSTLNINNTGAKSIKLDDINNFSAGNKAGMWFTAVYSSTADAYIIQGPQKHSHDANDVEYDGDINNLQALLYDLESKVNILTAANSGQTISVVISNESIDNWIIEDGYWNGTYISTGV